MVKRLRYLTIFFTLIFFVNIVSADFEVGDISHSIEEIYGKLDYIRGWINISLINELSNSIFEDGEDNSIDLIGLLNANPGYIYSCNPLDCQTDYSSNNGETTKTFDLDAGNSKIFGLRFTGDLESISTISFDAESNAPDSCKNQLKIDFLNDGTTEAQNNKASNNVCSAQNSGCFDDSQTLEEYILNGPYCQKIKLLESPGFKIGAWVKNISGSSETLIMGLYDRDGFEISTCELPQTNTGSKVSCDVDYAVTEKEDYYICIYTQEGGDKYRIRGYSDPINGCGFYNSFPIASQTAAYQIFAQSKKFDDVGTLQITNNLPYGKTLGDLAMTYILNRYGSPNPDCSGDCVVPIKFISGENQNIKIKNLNVIYEKSSGSLTEQNFYDVTENPAIINSEFQKLYLNEGNFSVPDDLGNYIFSLNLGGVEIIEEKVSVEDVPKIKFVRPITTASAFPTEFKVGVDFSSGIINYHWDFGDGSKTRTSTNRTTHTYQSTGTYKLKINVTYFRGFFSSKTFDIVVGLPKEVINSTLKDMKKNLENVKTQVSTFDSFSQKSLNSTLGISFIEDELENLEVSFSLATLEAEYNQILSELLSLNEVPELITKSRVADSVTFFPEKENVNVDIVQTIGGGSFESGKREKYMDAILAWNLENLETKITFKEFSAKYDSFTGPILKVFELKLNDIGDASNSNLIIRKLDNLEFDRNYLEREDSGYIYINLKDFPTTIIFSTTEDVDFVDLPAFISPNINKLYISEDLDINGIKKSSKWRIFILIVFFLFLAGFITYIVLQQWYKKKYENYLFKNKNDLYNMVTYVNNAKKRGLKRKEIAENLKKAGWSSEKVRYVMKKYAGKRTGMFEIPITNVLEKLKKREESKKR